MKAAELEFYRGKHVFVTGHTGFKGSWLCRILANAGAVVTGYSLEPSTEPNLFSIAGLEGRMKSIIGDIRNYGSLKSAFEEAEPDVVLHLAAQPLVRTSYEQPIYTYETNVIGTANLLDCVRTASRPVKSVLNVTTDKVYHNNEWAWGYRENEPLDGFDPYSNSKSCSELVTHCYQNSYFDNTQTAVSTARAGNVIGGGDFSRDRIIPDCIRSALEKKVIQIRNPYSVRPYQHVLETVTAYLMIAHHQYEEKQLSGWYNIGPDDCDCVTTGELAELFCQAWGNNQTWTSFAEKNAPHEATFLKLDCTKAKNTFGWKPRWHISEAVFRTVEWTKAWAKNGDVPSVMDSQLEAFLEE